VQEKNENTRISDDNTSEKEGISTGTSKESSTTTVNRSSTDGKPQAQTQNDLETAQMKKSINNYNENQPIKEEMEIIKRKAPVSEKVSLATLVLSKLSPSDISELKGMLKDGITAEEEARAKQILYSRFTAEDIERIKEAYIKYSNQ
jgi:hypothetical protein